MRIHDEVWIEGPYYIDFDRLDQLRIVGPGNHLHFGSVGLYRSDISIDSIEQLPNGRLAIQGSLKGSKVFFHDPVMAHIRKVRDRMGGERGQARRPFSEVVGRDSHDLLPDFIGTENSSKGPLLTYKRTYGGHWYGVMLQLPPDVSVQRQTEHKGFELTIENGDHIPFILIAAADSIPQPSLETVIKPEAIDFTSFGRLASSVEALWSRAAIEIEHLVQYNKTAGFGFGTVFPRDWMESADLGQYDLTPEALHYMYAKSLDHVDQHGVGWHEEIVGEYKYEEQHKLAKLESTLDEVVPAEDLKDRLKSLVYRKRSLYITRHMIDIEPHYLLGLDLLPVESWQPYELDRLRRVADYLVDQASRHDLITFKRIPHLMRRHRHEEFFKAGNWRDSEDAFKMVHPIIAPYDVNVVLYPQALAALHRHAQMLNQDPAKLERLIEKWSHVKDRYRFQNPDGRPAFALALYDIKNEAGHLAYKQLTVNHIDEAYEHFYGQPSEDEVVSFCERLLSADYFYTPSGPMLVGAKDGYTTLHYHGRVIWTKQTAYVVAGLARQVERAAAEKWQASTTRLIQKTIHKTTDASVTAWLALDLVPELYYDDGGQPCRYEKQAEAGTPMNKVQLWSSVGARRIIRSYLSVQEAVARHKNELI